MRLCGLKAHVMGVAAAALCSAFARDEIPCGISAENDCFEDSAFFVQTSLQMMSEDDQDDEPVTADVAIHADGSPEQVPLNFAETVAEVARGTEASASPERDGLGKQLPEHVHQDSKSVATVEAMVQSDGSAGVSSMSSSPTIRNQGDSPQGDGLDNRSPEHVLQDSSFFVQTKLKAVLEDDKPLTTDVAMHADGSRTVNSISADPMTRNQGDSTAAKGLDMSVQHRHPSEPVHPSVVGTVAEVSRGTEASASPQGDGLGKQLPEHVHQDSKSVATTEAVVQSAGSANMGSMSSNPAARAKKDSTVAEELDTFGPVHPGVAATVAKLAQGKQASASPRGDGLDNRSPGQVRQDSSSVATKLRIVAMITCAAIVGLLVLGRCVTSSQVIGSSKIIDTRLSTEASTKIVRDGARVSSANEPEEEPSDTD